MTHGKNICNQLKEVRKRIAEENDIPLEIEECTYKGECRGTCPRCEAEVRYLENALADRLRLGKVATVAGLALGLAATTAQAQVPATTIPTTPQDTDTTHKDIREPRVKDCIALAHEVLQNLGPAQLAQSTQSAQSADQAPAPAFFSRSELLYMVGNVSTQFLDSEYARRCLHIVADPVKMTTVEEDIEYLQLILGSLLDAEVITSLRPVGQGGLFATLVAGSGGRVGFDILTCREIRLDAFLFGEEDGRFIVSLPERNDDFFLLKMDEARINCCFLGHVTKGRVLVDDMDYGDIKSWVGKS